MVERTDLPARAFWRPLFVAPLAIPAFVNSYAWVSVIPSLHGLLGRSLGHDAVVLPVHVSAGGRDAAPSRPRPSRNLPVRSGSDSAGCVPPRCAAAAAAGDPRRRAPDRRAPARRVRRIRNGAIRHLHDRDLRAVPGHLRRCGGQHARRCARAALPGVAGRRGGGTWQRPIRQDRRGRTAGSDTIPLGPQHHTRIGGTGWARDLGARRARVDDPSLAVDRRHRRVGTGRHRHRARPDHRTGGRGGDPDDGACVPRRLGGGAVQWRARPCRRRRQLRHQFDAGHRHRACTGHRRDPTSLARCTRPWP